MTKSRENSGNATSDQTAWQFAMLGYQTSSMTKKYIVWIAKQTYAENKVSLYLSARSHRKLS